MFKEKIAEAYLESSQTSKMELSPEMVTLTNFAKSYIVDVWMGSEYVSVLCLTSIFLLILTNAFSKHFDRLIEENK